MNNEVKKNNEKTQADDRQRVKSFTKRKEN